jgi:hypothetical protein
MNRNTGPLSLSRFATLWDAEGEVEQVPDATTKLKYMYQRLDVRRAGADAVPYCWGYHDISFFPPGWRDNKVGVPEIERVKHYGFNDLSPHLLKVNGTWYEAGGGQVLWRNDEWQMRFTLDARTRHAEWANALTAGAAAI